MTISIYNLVCSDGTKGVLRIRLKDILEKVVGIPQNKVRFRFCGNLEDGDMVTLVMNLGKGKKIGRGTRDYIRHNLATAAKITLGPDEPIATEIAIGDWARSCYIY
ncbi:hypothetical protein BMS3Abin15_01129 [bacterium BMS3Abin15]|nr:hypothetical protein BMS3Abin15_01129 [bacterium BMS3Abin15]HDZ85824.1 hypothetical protein [Candidatus Moranbacteria bacterium]